MREVALQYEARLSAGLDFAAADLATEPEEGTLRYIRTTDIDSPLTLNEDAVYVDTARVPLESRVKEGDLLFTRAGSVGTSYLHRGPDAAFAGYLVRCRLNSDHDPRFFAYWAQSHPFRDQVAVGAIRSTIDNFSASKYAGLRVPLPSPALQRRIADYLDAEVRRIDRLWERNDELQRLVRERHERFVIAAVAEGIDHQPRLPAHGVDWMDAVVADFVIGPYAMFGRTGSGHTPSRSVPEYWVDCDIPWVTTADVQHLRDGFREVLSDTEHKISSLGMANSAARLHPAGTVFLSRTASVGFAGIMAVPMATSQDFFTWTPDSRLSSDYLLWSLRAMRYAGHFDRLMYGSTHKTIYVPDLMVLRGPVPPVDQQERIVSVIRKQRDETQSLIDRLQHSNQLLAERRQALITAAVTGELEV